MATFKYGSNSLLALTSRVTTPSIHIQKDGNHWYVPLFSGSKGAVVQSGDYNYTLGGLKIGIYRAVISREEAVNVEVVDIYVFASGRTTWILTSNGELYGCGQNNSGQQGSGTSGDSANVKTFTKRASNVKEVSCSNETTWYIDTSNNLYGCGSNDYGQQGSGTSGSSARVLTFTKRAENVKEVICSTNATWYIDNNNDLYGCGRNNYGQQGAGNQTDVLTFTKRAENVKTVRCSERITWYIDNNNNLYGCGDGWNGQQGDGTSGSSARVLTFTKRAENVKEVSCSAIATWYIDNNNDLYGCGSNKLGQQGQGSDDTNKVLTFTKRAENVKTVSCSDNTTWYIDTSNNLYGCGDNFYGQQGSGNTDTVLTFTKRAENVKTVSCSDNTTWYIDTSNNLYDCGRNDYGQQGSGDTTKVLTFTKRGENVKEVICTYGATWYIDASNNLYGCGYNFYGQQGSGNYSDVLTFTKRDYKTE